MHWKGFTVRIAFFPESNFFRIMLHFTFVRMHPWKYCYSWVLLKYFHINTYIFCSSWLWPMSGLTDRHRLPKLFIFILSAMTCISRFGIKPQGSYQYTQFWPLCYSTTSFLDRNLCRALFRATPIKLYSEPWLSHHVKFTAYIAMLHLLYEHLSCPGAMEKAILSTVPFLLFTSQTNEPNLQRLEKKYKCGKTPCFKVLKTKHCQTQGFIHVKWWLGSSPKCCAKPPYSVHSALTERSELKKTKQN